MENFIQYVNDWTDNGMYKTLANADTQVIFKFSDDVRKVFEDVKSTESEENVEIKLDTAAMSAVNVTKFAEEYITAKSRKIKTAAQVQLMSNVIFQALEELANTKIEIDDYKKTIKYLVKCSIHLKKLRVAWGDIRTFFINLKQMGKNIKTNSKTLRSQKEILVSREVDHVDIIMTNIKDATVKAYSLNIYIIEVANFYREIMQGGLLRKIRGLNFVKMSEKEVENLQKFILAEGKETQRRIREKVRYDQAKLARRLTRDIGDIRNHIACIMKDEPKVMEIMDDIKAKEKEIENYVKVADIIDAKSITEKVTAVELSETEIGKNDDLAGYDAFDKDLNMFDDF